MKYSFGKYGTIHFLDISFGTNRNYNILVGRLAYIVKTVVPLVRQTLAIECI